MNHRPSLAGVVWVAVAVAAVAVAAWVIPAIGQRGSNMPVEPRGVTARDPLAADEVAAIRLFETARVSVVYITTQERVVARLLSRLDDYMVGDTVRLAVLRDGRQFDTNVTLTAGSR